MAKIQAGRPAPKVSAKDEIILEVTDVFLRAKKYSGIAAVAALSSFTEQLDNKTLSTRAARKILDNKEQLAELLVKASQDYWDDLEKQFRERENKDLAVIKDNTAKKATIITAAAFCVMSPIVTAAEQLAANWAKAEVQSLFEGAKKNVVKLASTQKPVDPAPAAPDPSPQKTIVLQLGKFGFYDVATGMPPKLDGKEKVAVIVSTNSQPLLSTKRPQTQGLWSGHSNKHHQLKHCIQ